LLKQQEKWASALANDFHLLVDTCLCCDKNEITMQEYISLIKKKQGLRLNGIQ
jgi:hypothetical protein